jgi:hypothetical protein
MMANGECSGANRLSGLSGSGAGMYANVAEVSSKTRLKHLARGYWEGLAGERQDLVDNGWGWSWTWAKSGTTHGSPVTVARTGRR